jgi:small subunit ribosomal protein S9
MPTKNAYGLGRRKCAVAQVILTDTPAQRTVNGMPMDEYFTTVAMRNVVLESLNLTSQGDTHGFTAKVYGGGKNSQAGAVKFALARAIVKLEESFRKQLKDAGALSRDPRVKERKKPGLKRARRAPQFSKR